MEIVQGQRKSSGGDAVVPTSLQLYRAAPNLEVRLEDFELFAVDRLRGMVYNRISLISVSVLAGS